jgi:hypothetical protein
MPVALFPQVVDSFSGDLVDLALRKSTRDREEKREREWAKTEKLWSAVESQVHKKNPVSLSEKGVCHMQRETLCRGFMVAQKRLEVASARLLTPVPDKVNPKPRIVNVTVDRLRHTAKL